MNNPWVCDNCQARIYSSIKPVKCPKCGKPWQGKNPLSMSEKQTLKDWGNRQYAISYRYKGVDPVRSEFYHGRSVAAGKIARQFNPLTVSGSTTAIARKGPPEPLRWLHNQGLIKGKALDYGSGRQCWYDMTCYDPYWKPIKISGRFDTITCNYVLNVVPLSTQQEIIDHIRQLLAADGIAYFAVRRDLPKQGAPGRGTYQRYVTLDLPSIRRTSGYEIYKLSNRQFNPKYDPITEALFGEEEDEVEVPSGMLTGEMNVKGVKMKNPITVRYIPYPGGKNWMDKPLVTKERTFRTEPQMEKFLNKLEEDGKLHSVEGYSKDNPKRRRPKWRREGESLSDFQVRQRKYTDRVIMDMIEKKKNPSTAENIGNVINSLGILSVPLWIGFLIWAQRKFGPR